jgi:hypothetical protein
MGVVIRPRFGQPCFLCPNTVPWQRIRILAENVLRAGELLRKSDIVCVDCERSARKAEGPVEVTFTKPRRR